MVNDSPEQQSPPPHDTSYIVAIGASAGGIEALEQLIRHLPNDIPACYIIAQHLSPTHPSMLSELISRYSSLKTVLLKRTQVLQPYTIYITPPNKDVEYRDGSIRLLKTSTNIGANPLINRLFSTLGESAKEKSIGVILSGTGRDGAKGLKDIVNNGGMAIIQEPDTAKYDGMPKAALYSVPDPILLAPQEMGEHIRNICLSLPTKIAPVMQFTKAAVDALMTVLTKQSGINIRAFKEATIERRLVRRFSILGIRDPEEYLVFVQKNPEEATHFAESLSIAVTEFFRDKDIYNSLKALLESKLKEKHFNKQAFRIWVAGCASGEEAYSLAITLEEVYKTLGIDSNYQIFATDISEKLINESRKGFYAPENLKGMESYILENYFEQNTEYFSIHRRIRDKIFFSIHDLIKDPPFSNIDLVSCRNVLIYFQEEAKQYAFQSIYYALNDDAHLLLGANESLRPDHTFFDEFDSSNRIYSRKKVEDVSQTQRQSFKLPDLNIKVLRQAETTVALPIENQLSKLICREIIHPIILIDDKSDIVYTLGDISSIIDLSGGPFDRSLHNTLKTEYRQIINAIINRIKKKDTEDYDPETMVHHRKDKVVSLSASKFDSNRPGWFLLEFRTAPPLADNTFRDDSDEFQEKIFATMENELSTTKVSLQLVIQELENTNQEFQRSNEELLSANEELIATNEELHSTNEELLTVNEELENKTQQLRNTSTYLENIQSSIELPLIVVNKDMRVRRYVNAVHNLLKHKQIKEGDLITALDWKTSLHNLSKNIQRVMKTGRRHRSPVRMGNRHYQLYITCYLEDNKKQQGAIIYFTDVTELVTTQRQLKEEQERAHVTLESIADGVIRLNSMMEIDYINPVAEKLSGWQERDAIGKNAYGVLKMFEEDSSESIRNIFENKEKTKILICRLINRQNDEYLIEYTCSPLVDEEGQHIGSLFVFRDVSERRAAMKKIIWQSSHDPLTGLVNRNEIELRLEKSLISAKSKNTQSTFMYLDLDQFKIVNDTCGHLAGDELLRRITQQIHHQLRSRDTLARLGGDEFGVLLENCPIENANMIAQKIRDSVVQYRFVWDEKLFKVGVCIGIVSINKYSSSVSQLFRDADSACYAAKSNGGNSIQIHMENDEQLNQQRQQMSVIADINDALENNRFRLYYQPIYDAQNNSISHWEVLLRMINRRSEFLLPNKFLAASERFGLIKQIDEWVVENTFDQLLKIHSISSNKPKLAINLSASTLADSAAKDHIIELLNQNKGLHGNLIFEITETSALSNIKVVNEFIEELRGFGCICALDDFGTGVSTYSYLNNLNIDMIKIDGEFIHDITENKINREIVKSIVHISKMMDITTVAEKIENKEADNYLCSIGIDLRQGFYLGRPVPAEEFVSAVLNNHLLLNNTQEREPTEERSIIAKAATSSSGK